MKSKEVLELEKYLGFDLNETNHFDLDNSKIKSKSYSLNENEKLLGLNLKLCKISNLSFLKGLFNLTNLSLSTNQISDICFLQGLTRLTNLNLSNNQISDISFLQGLTNLTSLNLNTNEISDISFLQGLTNLTDLSLSNNQISDISFLQGLKNLTNLNLSNNKISNISFLQGLTNLTNLNLSNNQINNISFLQGLTNLTIVGLNSNRINDMSYLQELTKLTTLSLSSNQISNISFLKWFTNLNTLSLSDNQISNIFFLQELTKLTTLNLNNNKINDISFLQGLTNLTNLSLNNNDISEIFYLKELTNISYLNLIRNKIKIHPAYWSQNFYSCKISDNPLVHPPIGIVNQGEHAIKKYFEEININSLEIEYIGINNFNSVNNKIIKKGTINLYEAKLVMIGNGEVGKSSIRTKLMDRNAELPKLSTHGIDTFEWTIKIKHEQENIDFKLNVWDFGGQGEYRSIQQFFCTRNSIYIYVTSYDDEAINNKDEYVGFDYWYPFVQAYGYNEDTHQFSPLLHVRNKKDKIVLPIDEKVFKDLYPDIYSEYLQVSCTTLENIDRLEEVIKIILPYASNDMFSREYPTSWMLVKEELEIMRKKTYNYISLSEYHEICHKHNLDLEAAAIWLKELDNIGTVIYFGRIKSLENLVILNPEWLKEAAYRVLKKQTIRKNYGEFKDFSEVWKGGSFPKELHPQLEELMLSFEICYRSRDERNKPTYYVPSLFPSRTDEEKNVFDEIIEEHEIDGFLYKFILKYDLYMPAGLLHKLIVRHNKETQSQYRWRDCAILHYKGTYAEIVENWKEKQLEFKIKGKSPEGLFRFIKKAIDKISQELVDVKFIKPLTYKITAYYEDDYETIKSLRKMTEAREIFWFLFANEKPIKENTKNTLVGFQSTLLNLLENEQQNAIADILAQIKDSNYSYNKIQYKDIENNMGIMGQGIQAQNIVNTTKILIHSLREK